MKRRSLAGVVLRLVVSVVLAAGGLLWGMGCQRFDAAEPLGEEVEEQFANFPADVGNFLQWSLDEVTGNPDSWGP